jgi:hypothetical protein
MKYTIRRYTLQIISQICNLVKLKKINLKGVYIQTRAFCGIKLLLLA